MIRSAAKRVVYVVAAQQLEQWRDTGAYVGDAIHELVPREVRQLERALGIVIDELYAKGSRFTGPVCSLDDAFKVAGVAPRYKMKAPGGDR